MRKLQKGSIVSLFTVLGMTIATLTKSRCDHLNETFMRPGLVTFPHGSRREANEAHKLSKSS